MALNKDRKHIFHGNESARQFAGTILRLADKFSEPTSTEAKSMADIQDVIIAGVHPSHCFLQFAHAMKKGVEKQSPTESSEALLSRGITFDITRENAIYPSHSSRHPVQVSQISMSSASSNTGICAVSLEQTLCWV